MTPAELKQKLHEKHIERKAEIAKLKTMIADLSVELSEKRRIIYRLQTANRTIEKSYEKIVQKAYSEAEKIQSLLNDEKRESRFKDFEIKLLKKDINKILKITACIIFFCLSFLIYGAVSL